MEDKNFLRIPSQCDGLPHKRQVPLLVEQRRQGEAIDWNGQGSLCVGFFTNTYSWEHIGTTCCPPGGGGSGRQVQEECTDVALFLWNLGWPSIPLSFITILTPFPLPSSFFFFFSFPPSSLSKKFTHPFLHPPIHSKLLLKIILWY